MPVFLPAVISYAAYRRMTDTDRWFGCFRWLYDRHRKYIALHFRNAYTPRSPFEDSDRLFRSLRRVIRDIDTENLPVTTVGCDSWLDALSSFQQLFPASFARSLEETPGEVKTGNGWWGQFVTHRGTLNARRAEILRKKLRFELPRMHGECPFLEFKKHVDRALANS